MTSLHNREIEELYNEPNTVKVRKSIRMRWAGHVVRMDDEDVADRNQDGLMG